MLVLKHLLSAALSIVILAILFIFFIKRCFCFKKGGEDEVVETTRTRTESLQDGISKLHQLSFNHQVELNRKRRRNYYIFRKGVSARRLFNWADHPSLITDAVENGWSRFGFTGYNLSPLKSSLLSLCAVGDYRIEEETEISWEVCQGSADFMQKIRLNKNSSASVIRTALPLPGPPLENSAFPQEAYFEITVLYSQGEYHECITKEEEKTKLILENSNPKSNSESLIQLNSSHPLNNIEELKLSGNGDAKNGEDDAVMFLGLTTGGSLPLKHPGSYQGSVGFNSNGSVYLDGIKIVVESKKGEWARKDKVIGCGFDPRQKKVFFTVDGELVHVIHGKSEEFGTPLYPTIAANKEIMVIVNFGQSSFNYAPANAQRTPNPCFIGPLVNSSALGYEDSKELFSMGRIDSQWLNRSTTKITHNNNNNNNNNAVDFDEESEADLFELDLDGNERSAPTVL